jgi:hypothetical protein
MYFVMELLFVSFRSGGLVVRLLRCLSGIVLIVWAGCLTSGRLEAQDRRQVASPIPVFNSPDGAVILFGGSAIGSDGKDNTGTQFIISRSEGSSNTFVPLLLRGMVRNMQALKKLTGQPFVSQLRDQLRLSSEDALWVYLQKHPDLSAYGLASFNIPFRVAMGAAYIDGEVKGQKGKRYTYKIDVEGTGPKASFSASITIGEAPDYAAPALSLAKAGDSMVTLRWRLHPGKDIPFLAMVYRQDGGRGEFQRLNARIIATHKGDSAVFVFTERVRPNSAYRYFIRPADLMGNAGLFNSDTASVVAADFRKMPFVSQLKATDTLNGILLSWKPVAVNPLITGIEIQRSRDSRGDYVIIDTVSALAGSYLDRKLLPHIAYYYRLCVLHAGRQLQSEKVYMVVSADQQKASREPDAPYGISAQSVAGGVLVHWQPVNNADLYAYYVYRGSSLDTKMEVISPSLGDTSFIDTSSNLSRQTNYVYAVTAVSNAGKESPFSQKLAARLPKGKERPQTPGGIRITRVEGRLLVQWEDVRRNDPGILGYILYKHPAGMRPLQYDVTKPGSQEAGRLQLTPVIAGVIRDPYLEDTLPLRGRRMEYLVSAIDVFGVESGLSAVSAAPGNDIDPLKPPVRLFARVVKEGVALQWEQADTTGVEGFVIYRRIVSEKNARRIARVDNKANHFTDREVASGALYVYTVTSVGAGGETAAGDEHAIRK